MYTIFSIIGRNANIFLDATRMKENNIRIKNGMPKKLFLKTDNNKHLFSFRMRSF